jgi:hypothetical protein
MQVGKFQRQIACEKRMTAIAYNGEMTVILTGNKL